MSASFFQTESYETRPGIRMTVCIENGAPKTLECPPTMTAGSSLQVCLSGLGNFVSFCACIEDPTYKTICNDSSMEVYRLLKERISLLWTQEDIPTMDALVRHPIVPHQLWFVRTPLESDKEPATKKRRKEEKPKQNQQQLVWAPIAAHSMVPTMINVIDETVGTLGFQTEIIINVSFQDLVKLMDDLQLCQMNLETYLQSSRQQLRRKLASTFPLVATAKETTDTNQSSTSPSSMASNATGAELTKPFPVSLTGPKPDDFEASILRISVAGTGSSQWALPSPKSVSEL